MSPVTYRPSPAVRRRNIGLLTLSFIIPATLAAGRFNGHNAGHVLFISATASIAVACMTIALFVTPNMRELGREARAAISVLFGLLSAAAGTISAGSWLAEGVSNSWVYKPWTVVLCAALAVVSWVFVLSSGYTGLDLIDRRRHDEEVVALVRQLDMGQALTAIGSYQVNLKNGRSQWSSQMFVLLGMEPQPAGHHPGFDEGMKHVHPDDRDAVAKDIAEAMVGDGVWDHYFRVVREVDATVRMMHGRGRVLYEGGSDAATAIVGTVQDVTQRRTLDGRLHERRRTQVRAEAPSVT